MKILTSICVLFVVSIVLLNCKSGSEDVKPIEIIDTVIVRDTIRVAEIQAFLSASRMNVLYIGVDNPLDLEVAGIDAGDFSVEFTRGSGTIKNTGSGRYIATVAKPEQITITASSAEFTKDFYFRGKRIPDPAPRLANAGGGKIHAGTFKAQRGMVAVLENFDFEAKFSVTSFTVKRIPLRGQPQEIKNRGALFLPETQALIKLAKPGDFYLFTEIRAKSPVNITRKLPDMVFEII